MALTWAPATDDHTPSAGLNYNLYVGDSPQSQTVVGLMADVSTGYRRVTQLGNSQPTSFTLTGLSQNKTYYWSVQAVDGAFAGSPFASQQSFVPRPFIDTSSQIPSLPNVANSSMAWGDYDNDGKLDLLLTGSSGSGPVSKLYRNTGTGFTDQSSLLPGMPGIQSGAIAWGDYDNDGKLDLIITGSNGSTFTSKLYRNLSQTANVAPTAPSSLTSTISPDGKSVVLTWQPTTDDHTPSAALSYNLYVSDSPQSQTVVSAMADQTTGFRRVVRLGNSQPTSYTLTGLSQGKTYYWSVQALDASFAGSPFAGQQQFSTGYDLVPILYARPSIAYGPTSFSVVVDVVEVKGVATTGPITLRISRDSRVSLSLPGSLTSVGNRTVQNAVWRLDASNPSYYALTTDAVIQAGNRLSVGLTGQLSPGNTTGIFTISSVLVGNQGEVRLNNNSDADKVEYFSQ